MNGGAKTVVLVSCLGLAACTAGTGGVKVRAIADPASAISGTADPVAVARGQLLLGNVGLALEGFRKAQRYNPSNPAPLAGIGDCYAAMGRFDLAQSNYESALALAPNDRKLLLGLASIFDSAGQPMRAAAVRAEAASGAQPTQAAQLVKMASAPLPSAESGGNIVASVGSITVDLPPARPREALEAHALASAALQTLDDPSVEPSVTVPLPPTKPSKPRPAGGTDDNRTMAVLPAAPRLERLSRGEVALVTTGFPVWRERTASRMTPVSSSVRWVALESASRKPNVQILNAARSRGLAASARTVLSGRGWRQIAIGDAPAVQRRSVVLFPKSRAALGRRLAAQFGVSARMVERGNVVLVLGTDAVRSMTGQRRA